MQVITRDLALQNALTPTAKGASPANVVMPRETAANSRLFQRTARARSREALKWPPNLGPPAKL